jgi:hypothetical protein
MNLLYLRLILKCVKCKSYKGVGLGLTGPELRYYEHNYGPSGSIKRMGATVSSMDSVCAICICLLTLKVSRLGQMSSYAETIIL